MTFVEWQTSVMPIIRESLYDRVSFPYTHLFVRKRSVCVGRESYDVTQKGLNACFLITNAPLFPEHRALGLQPTRRCWRPQTKSIQSFSWRFGLVARIESTPRGTPTQSNHRGRFVWPGPTLDLKISQNIYSQKFLGPEKRKYHINC